jgi:hypothetical protein
MDFTSGDLYFTISTGGIVIAFVGVGMAIAQSRRKRLLGGLLYALGLALIGAPTVGLVGALMRHL